MSSSECPTEFLAQVAHSPERRWHALELDFFGLTGPHTCPEGGHTFLFSGGSLGPKLHPLEAYQYFFLSDPGTWIDGWEFFVLGATV